MKFNTKYDRNYEVSFEDLKDNELVVDRKGYLNPQQYYYSVLNGTITLNDRSINKNDYDNPEGTEPSFDDRYDSDDDVVDQMNEVYEDFDRQEEAKRTQALKKSHKRNEEEQQPSSDHSDPVESKDADSKGAYKT